MSTLLRFSNVLSGKCLIWSTVTRARVPRQAAALFEKYGVAAYFAGHTHSYWRSAPTYANLTVPPGMPRIPASTVFNPRSAATTCAPPFLW